ncbi:hypothetical protein [Halomonas sp. KO116]|uniref:hypothetical protein n=1 Tax=Halomonas sp. KO116 TaxID=1504981 RepID=UPI0004E3937A|nr:hypothetical protein [Halomonas sp. KO116]AJY52349.1 hypothetical protein KO116_03882 [Halomonas sp. KO116]
MSKLKENQVIILAPNVGAIKSVNKSYFSFDINKITNSAIEKIIKYLAASLNCITEEEYGVAINYDTIFFSTENPFDKNGAVFFLDTLKDPKTSQEIIEKSRTLALFIIQQLLPNDDLFSQSLDLSWLGKEQFETLEERRKVFLSRWKNAKISDGFSLIDTIEKESLLYVNSEFIALDDEEKTNISIEGIGLPDGFSRTQNWIELRVIEDSLQQAGDIRHFTINHPEDIKVFLEASYQESYVRFKAKKITQKMKQKPSYILTELKIDNTLIEMDQFTLTSESEETLDTYN